MATYSLGQLTLAQLRELAEIRDRGVLPELWEERQKGQLSEAEQTFLTIVRRFLITYRTNLVNEATLWARAIYPLLALAERDNIRAYAEVPLSASLPRGELRGEVDGALARMDIEGSPRAPYLLIVEAKRGIEGHEPVTQLLAGLLCAAWHNHKDQPQAEHRLHGVYTVSDVWTFVQATVSGMDSERPVITTATSREYYEQTEAATIVLLLRSMTAELPVR